MLYIRFIIFLAIGLFGVAMLLKTLLDALFVDWDVTGDMRRLAEDISKRRRYVRMEKQAAKAGAVSLATRGVVEERQRVAREEQFLAPPDMMSLRLPLPPAGDMSSPPEPAVRSN